ncbi:MAG TPA: hypothetical protein V6C72_07675 [Chroococcales cyanobacterium]
MISLVLLGAVLAFAVFGIVWVVVHFAYPDRRITQLEFIGCAAGLVLVVVPLTCFVGYKVAVSNNLSYNEFWGGFEVSVDTVVYQCHESDTDGGSTGGCEHHYDADSYQVWVQHETCTTDSKGKETCVDDSHWETRWRQVPYTDEEITYIVHTTLGDFTIGDHWLPPHPELHRVHPEEDAMESIPGDLPYGIPAFWQAAANRIASGNPGPVTQERTYDNYILASQSSILHKYSPWIDQYKKANLLPNIGHSVHDFYWLDRVYTVGGVNIGDAGTWQRAMDRFDAALGIDLTGDAYLVVVPADKISDPDTYVMSLAAYWESPAFQKYAISKNGIIIVVGTRDGKTVDWARATTGMPSGNEQMLLDIKYHLGGVALTPGTLLGAPTAAIATVGGKYKVTINHTQGALESILWGQDKFQRVHMGAHDGQQGYLYLKGEIVPSGWQKFWIMFFVVLFSGITWGVAFAYGVPAYRARQARFQ